MIIKSCILTEASKNREKPNWKYNFQVTKYSTVKFWNKYDIFKYKTIFSVVWYKKIDNGNVSYFIDSCL